jgi:hypothetical protein
MFHPTIAKGKALCRITECRILIAKRVELKGRVLKWLSMNELICGFPGRIDADEGQYLRVACISAEFSPASKDQVSDPGPSVYYSLAVVVLQTSTALAPATNFEGKLGCNMWLVPG